MGGELRVIGLELAVSQKGAVITEEHQFCSRM